MTVAQVYAAGSVLRYHANPLMARLGQSNADHQGRCVQLLFALHPSPPVYLIEAVAHHDLGERWAGDLPGPFKDANPEVARLHAETESHFAAFASNCCSPAELTGEDLQWLMLVDKLEAWCFMRLHAPLEKDDHGWPAARKAVIARAWSLGPTVSALVQELCDDLDARRW